MVSSYLTLDVNSAESGGPGCFEQLPSFACQDCDIVRPLFEQILTTIINDELGSVGIGFEAKLFSDESQSYVRLVPVEGVSMLLMTPQVLVTCEREKRDRGGG